MGGCLPLSPAAGRSVFSLSLHPRPVLLVGALTPAHGPFGTSATFTVPVMVLAWGLASGFDHGRVFLPIPMGIL